MSSFFAAGAVDTNSINRMKLPVGVYKVSLTDLADYYGATNGDRTQINFTVVEGCVSPGTKGSHVVMHAADAQWKREKSRGEIASSLGAFLGFSRDASGLKITAEVFEKNTRVVQQSGGKTVSVTRDADDLPLVQSGAQAFLVVAPYFDKRTGARKFNPKTKQPSVTYELLPLSAKLTVTTAGESTESGEFAVDAPEAPQDDAPAAPSTPDAMELALQDGWKRNGTSAFFYKKGAPAQLKEPALRAMYGG